ncbi:MAG: aminomethyl-transferring glycine dehydrogenase subunit GcvPB, partial [Pseudomonadota bacterium]
MLIEPTETESRRELDRFADALLSIAERARRADPSLKQAPMLAPMRRLDETQAARRPVLTWSPSVSPVRRAAE